MIYRLLILFCLFISNTLLACSENKECIEESSWHLGIAFGVGVKTNPLVGGDNMPFVILPDIAWYAEKAYLDNDELGYQWLNQPQYAIETYVQLGRENALFNFLHPANILLPPTEATASSDSVDSPELSISPNQDRQNEPSLSIDDIASRKWTVNAGIRGHYFFNNSEWQLAFKQDISNVHRGQYVSLQYSHRWLWQQFNFTLRTGADWKSARVTDYYYGVSERDTDLKELHFKGKSGWQTYISLNATKPINENWSWLTNISYRRLPNSLTRSPLVEENNIRNVFLGVAYRF